MVGMLTGVLLHEGRLHDEYLHSHYCMEGNKLVNDEQKYVYEEG